MATIPFGPKAPFQPTGKLAIQPPKTITIRQPAPRPAHQQIPLDPAKLASMGLTAAEAHAYNAGHLSVADLAKRSTARLGAQTHTKLLEANAYGPRTKTESMGAPIAPTDLFGKTVEDLANAGIGLPAGLYQTGKAIGSDALTAARDLTARPGEHLKAPTETYNKVLVPTAKGFAESAEHPLRHPGYTLLNAWAVGSLGAGALARAAAVREAIAGTAGEDAATAVRNLPRADRQARDVLLDPISNFNPADKATLAKIATPSKRLGQLLDVHPGMAEARTAVLQRAGLEAQAVRARTPLETATEVGRALVRRPAPAERTISAGDLEVHPLASRNPLTNRLQRALDANTEGRLGYEGPQRDFMSAEWKVGKELAAARAVTEAKEQGIASRLENFGRTTKSSVLRNAARRPLRGRLSAGEQKAIDIVSSGLTPAEHFVYHTRAAELAAKGVKEYGDAAAHETQAALVRAAEQHLANPSPNLQEAVRLTRTAVQKREQILGLNPDEIAHRVGARVAEIKSMGEGLSSPHLQRAALVEQLKELPPHLPTEQRLALHARLEQIEQQTFAREREVGVRRAKTDGFLTNLNREGSEIKTRLDQDAQRSQLQLELEQIDHRFIQHGREAIDRGAFYLPSKSLAPLRRPHQASVQASEYGYRPPANLPELEHAYTAALERSGNYRTDATGLAADAYRGAQRLASLQRGFEQILKLAQPTKELAGGDKYAIPVRETASIPQALREYVLRADRGELSEEDLKAIQAGEGDVRALVQQFLPSSENVPGIKYVDVRLVKRLAEQRALPSTILKAFDSVNNVGRGSILYLKPAYIVNLLQNLGTAAIEQGPFMLRNARAAATLGRKLGADDQHMIFSLVGEGHTRALDVGAGLGERAVHGAAQFWSAVTDRYPRVMAFLHEARAAGFDSPTTLKALLHDPRFEKQLVQVTRRANHEMVSYDGMTPLERNTIRRVFLFYPWLRGATVWSLRFPLEHPLQAAVYGQLGRQGREWEEKTLGKLPSFMEGVFPLLGLRPKDAHPFVTNPAALNTFLTPIQAGQAVAGLAGPAGAAHAGDLGGMLTPALGALTPLISGKSSLGYDLPAGESRLTGAADELLGAAAPVSLAQKALQRDLVTGRKLPAGSTEKGPEAAVRSAALGALGGTHLDLAKAHEQELKEEMAGLTSEQRVTAKAGQEIAAMPQALAQLKRQGIDVQPVHQRQVRDAIHFEAQRDLAYDAAAKQAGISAQKLPAIDKLTLTVQVLHAHGRLTAQQAQEWTQYFANADDATISKATEKLWSDLGPGSVLSWWRGLVTKSEPKKRTPSQQR